MDRRKFLYAGFLATVAVKGMASSKAEKRPRILLRSSWQTVNIGDIAHTPGLLAIIERFHPDWEVVLWPSRIDNGVKEMLLARFPALQIVETGEDLKQAFQDCNFLLHGSGASLVAQRDVVRWSEATGKPYGIYAITLPTQESSSTKPTSNDTFAATIEVLNRAAFVFFRDSVSLQLAKDRGCRCPIMQFAPDAAFATDLRDEAKAVEYLRDNDLQAGKFMCCIPRLRYTPYWMIPEKHATLDLIKHARNEAMKEHDHAPHRRAIIDVVEQTDLKILICPEDRTQMAVGKEMIYDRLPERVQKRVVWRPNYWLTGEAISIYICSAGLFGNEMHSPIMCIGNGVPAIVCRWAEQTSKGFMWQDIGLQDWLFDFDDEADIDRYPATVLSIAKDSQSAKATAIAARDYVSELQNKTMEILAGSI